MIAPTPFRPQPLTRRGGFTMTELMVVIGIIAVLAGILLTAMRGVRTKAMQTQTMSTMQEISKAADAFQMVHNRYPGVVPEGILADPSFGGFPPLSGMENALLDLMGGYRLKTPMDGTQAQTEYGLFNGVVRDLGASAWQIKIDVNRIGEGPHIEGRAYAPYFTPAESQLSVADGQMRTDVALEDCDDPAEPCLPDLLDAWGQPIIYVRRARTSGPLVGNPVDQPQFYMDSMNPHLKSIRLGKAGKDQTDSSGGSILNVAPASLIEATFAQIIRHPSLGEDDPTAAAALAGTAQGAYVLISAGPDGIYFSTKDGPGTPKAPVENIVDDAQYGTPTIVRQYNDIRVFGGG